MRTLVVLLACSAMLAACGAQPTRPVINATPPAQVVPFTLVSQGAPLGDHPKEAFYGVVATNQAWEDLRAKVPDALVEAGEKDAQAGKVVYLAVFSGAKSSSGYALEVQKITCQAGACTIFLNEKELGAGTVVEPAMTLPYLLISVKSSQFNRGSKVVFVFKNLQGGLVYQQEATIP